jgi:adenosylhomocysteine nucleosidase
MNQLSLMMRKKLLLVVLLSTFGCVEKKESKIVVVISANTEWRVVKSMFSDEDFKATPWGEFFETQMKTQRGTGSVIFFHEGWGKVAAAGATQYAIDRWNPSVIINLGTCGGFEGSVDRFDILLIDRTVIYDIKEAMGDSKEAIMDYATELDLSWLSVSDTIKKTVLVSADRDLVPEEIPALKAKYGAIAGDWETGAIAFTCKRNNKKLLVLRGVSDLVNTNSGEAYGKVEVFEKGTTIVMNKLLKNLPLWIEKCNSQETVKH